MSTGLLSCFYETSPDSTMKKRSTFHHVHNCLRNDEGRKRSSSWQPASLIPYYFRYFFFRRLNGSNDGLERHRFTYISMEREIEMFMCSFPLSDCSLYIKSLLFHSRKFPTYSTSAFISLYWVLSHPCPDVCLYGKRLMPI